MLVCAEIPKRQKAQTPLAMMLLSIKQRSDHMQGLDAIKKYFTVEDAPRQKDKYLVVCEKCGDMWHLSKSSTHPGNVLHLLNHARGHDKKGRRP
jgi:hypothetical protein